METAKDSVIMIGKSSGAIMLSMWSALPDVLRVAILIATLVHIVVKINNDRK